MSLLADVMVDRGDGFRLDVALEVRAGTTVAVLGPNGAGKSTLLEAIVGLSPVTEGTISLDGVVMCDTSADISLPPRDRPVGVVFQDGLLFGHMTVFENVAFGPSASGLSGDAASQVANAWLDRLGVASLSDKKASELSGGEAQRVAIARALACEPEMLLLDEPMSALDATSKIEVRRMLVNLLPEFEGPRVLITHDPTEAFLLADQIVVVENGRVTQTGTAQEIRLHPNTRYVADLAGLNLYRGTAENGELNVGGHLMHSADRGPIGDVVATVDPRAVAIHKDQPGGSPRNVWATHVTNIEDYGDRVRIQTSGPLIITAEVTPESLVALELTPGSQIFVSVKATEVILREV